MTDDYVELENDENNIRDVLLLKYLKNNTIRKELLLNDYNFDREVPEDNSLGRTDIKIQTINTFYNTEAYYIIECKRLNNKNLRGNSGLNAEYVKNGMNRFVTGYYSSHYNTNGMIGFVVDDLDIDNNYENINHVLNTHYPQINVTALLEEAQFIENFRHQYISIHLTKFNRNIILYHLMLDFSKNIGEQN